MKIEHRIVQRSSRGNNDFLFVREPRFATFTELGLNAAALISLCFFATRRPGVSVKVEGN